MQVLKKTVLRIPNLIQLSVTAVQTFRFNTIGFLHLKSEKVLEGQGFALWQDVWTFQSPSRMAGPDLQKSFNCRIWETIPRTHASLVYLNRFLAQKGKIIYLPLL